MQQAQAQKSLLFEFDSLAFRVLDLVLDFQVHVLRWRYDKVPLEIVLLVDTVRSVLVVHALRVWLQQSYL